jgi:hypothetical protein
VAPKQETAEAAVSAAWYRAVKAYSDYELRRCSRSYPSFPVAVVARRVENSENNDRVGSHNKEDSKRKSPRKDPADFGMFA